MPRRSETQKKRKAARRARLRRSRRDPVTGRPTTSHQRNDRRPTDGEGVVVCATGKAGFTRRVAEAKLEEFGMGHGNRRRVVRRVYKCDTCHHWHLTSQESRDG